MVPGPTSGGIATALTKTSTAECPLHSCGALVWTPADPGRAGKAPSVLCPHEKAQEFRKMNKYNLIY